MKTNLMLAGLLIMTSPLTYANAGTAAKSPCVNFSGTYQGNDPDSTVFKISQPPNCSEVTFSDGAGQTTDQADGIPVSLNDTQGGISQNTDYRIDYFTSDALVIEYLDADVYLPTGKLAVSTQKTVYTLDADGNLHGAMYVALDGRPARLDSEWTNRRLGN